MRRGDRGIVLKECVVNEALGCALKECIGRSVLRECFDV